MISAISAREVSRIDCGDTLGTDWGERQGKVKYLLHTSTQPFLPSLYELEAREREIGSRKKKKAQSNQVQYTSQQPLISPKRLE